LHLKGMHHVSGTTVDRDCVEEQAGASAPRPGNAGVTVQHFFVARLSDSDESARSGAEFRDPSRGGYELDRVELRGEEPASIDLKPVALKEFILANREALLAEATAT
jgi:hypothetical protein